MIRRKLLCCAISMIIGICLAVMSVNLIVIFALPLAFFLLPERKLSGVLLICLLAGSLSVFITEYNIDHHRLNQYIGKNATITGKITGIEQVDKESYQITCDVSGGKLLVRYFHQLADYPELLGNKICFSANIEKPKPAGNPRTFDYSQYLKSKKIYHITTTQQFHVTSTKKSLIDQGKSYLLTKREGFFKELSCTGESKSFLRGVLFGDTHELDEGVNEEFRINGTAHILAVSGLHMGMLYGAYQWLCRKRKSKLLMVAFVFLLLIYGTVSLWSVSVTRAIILVLLIFMGQLTNRRYDIVTALSAAALYILINNPFMVINAGFQMSFLAVLSIGFIKPFLQKYMGSGLAMALSVQMGLMPYIAYNFNYISIIGIICNVPIVFLTSLVVPIGIGGFLFFLASGIEFPAMGSLLDVLVKLTVEINHQFAAGGLFSKDTISPPLWVICLVYGLIFLITSEFFLINRKRKDYKKISVVLMGILLSASIVCFWERTPFDDAGLIFLDVGQGDSLHLKGDQNILIDGGGNIRFDVGKKTLKPYLLKNGVSHIDLAAATHLHTDHYLGLQQLTQCFDVRQMLIEGRSGQVINISKGVFIEILWPEVKNPDTEDENLNSLIFRVHQNGITALITGDITEEGERALLDKYRGTGKLGADILKIAHHGSKYSSCEEFLDEVKPKVAVISVGKNNYGHPSNHVIEKLRKKGIMVYRTDIFGAIGIINRKGKVTVCTKNQ